MENNENIEELRKIQLGILDHIDQFCKDNGIKYFLSCGTLLGAVRHQGYIPWDDDIDIMLVREDYENLISLYPKIDNSHFCLLHHTLDNNYPFPFAKLVDNRTNLIENYETPYNTGVYMDIFPIDSFPTTIKEEKKLLGKIRKLKYLLQFKRITKKENRKEHNKLKNFLASLRKPFFFIFPISYYWINTKMDNISKGYKDSKDSKYKGNIVWGYFEKDKIPNDCFSKTIELEFEGTKYPVPVGYDKYLKCLYGDYMKLPPVEERARHSITWSWK